MSDEGGDGGREVDGGGVAVSGVHATLRDVAEAAGVAISTASRALTRPGRVAAATEARVREAADVLGYAPSASARALTLGRTRTVALVVPDMVNPFFFAMVRGVQSRLREDGFVHVLVDTEESAEREEEALARLRGSVDGVVLAAPRSGDAVISAWADVVPVVVVNRDVHGPRVVTDTPGGAVQSLQHLASLGHRRVAYAAGPARSWSNLRRVEALRVAAPRLGIEVVELGPFVPRREGGPAAADAALLERCTAVVAFNDLLAFGVLDRLRERGVDVPGDVSVVGCDDVFGADLVRPALTTVSVPIERAGRAAADLLLRRLGALPEGVWRGSGPGRSRMAERRVVARGGAMAVDLTTHLVVRASTGPAPV